MADPVTGNAGEVSKPSSPKFDEKSGLPAYEKGDGVLLSDEGLTVVLKDGIRLQPQPTSDPYDPLNWSSFQKNSLLAIVMAL